MKLINYLFTLSLVGFILLPFHPMMAQGNANIEAVKSVLNRQAEDWNRGDIPAFMEGYWKSKKLQFIGANGVTYGWQQTKDNYLKGYPDKATMGKLEFGIIQVEQLSKKVIMLTGTWDLTRANDKPGGHFLLIWKKVKKKWVIIADHTSVRS